jgi:hypothetical protein
VDDIAVLVAEAIARRVKEGRARQALATPGTAAKPAAAQPAPPVAKAAAAPAKPPPRPAPPSPVSRPAAGGDDFFAMPLDAPRLMATAPLLDAFSSAPALLAAFVLHEALGKPVALRDDGGTFPGPLRSNE